METRNMLVVSTWSNVADYVYLHVLFLIHDYENYSQTFQM